MEDKNNLVNFFVNYYNPKNSSDKAIENRKYYSSNKAKDYINYISTGIADIIFCFVWWIIFSIFNGFVRAVFRIVIIYKEIN